MKKITLLSAIIAAAIWTGCSDLDTLSGVIRATSGGRPLTGPLLFSHSKGDSKTIEITSIVLWQVTEKPEWIEINPLSGFGYERVTITVTNDNHGVSPLHGEIVFTTTSGDNLIIKVVQEIDSYISFKANAVPRWERGTAVEKNEESAHTFIIDTGNKLSPMNKYKTGRITKSDGSDYEIIEFNLDVTGQPAVGKQAGAQIRKPSGVTALYSLDIVQIENGRLWMVFKESATAPERRVVQ